jgi:hypothetical protein
MTDDDPLVKISGGLLVSKELLRDCQVNLTEYLRNPYLRPPCRPLTRRQKLRNQIAAVRLAAAERLYRLVSGQDAADVHWGE